MVSLKVIRRKINNIFFGRVNRIKKLKNVVIFWGFEKEVERNKKGMQKRNRIVTYKETESKTWIQIQRTQRKRYRKIQIKARIVKKRERECSLTSRNK